MDLILGRLLRNVGYQYRTEKACHCCNGSSLAGTSLRCSGQWIRVCAEAPPPSYRAILRRLFLPSRRQETRAGSARPRVRNYAVTRAYFEGRKTASKCVTDLAPSIRFLTWGRKAASLLGPKNGPRIGPPKPSKNGTSRTGQILPNIAGGARCARQTSVPRRFRLA